MHFGPNPNFPCPPLSLKVGHSQVPATHGPRGPQPLGHARALLEAGEGPLATTKVEVTQQNGNDQGTKTLNTLGYLWIFVD